MHRKISVIGTGGISATIILTAQQGAVWMSIQPPFTWEAIIEPKKIDELIGTLTQAKEEAKRLDATGKRPTSLASQQVITNPDYRGRPKPAR